MRISALRFYRAFRHRQSDHFHIRIRFFQVTDIPWTRRGHRALFLTEYLAIPRSSHFDRGNSNLVLQEQIDKELDSGHVFFGIDGFAKAPVSAKSMNILRNMERIDVADNPFDILCSHGFSQFDYLIHRFRILGNPGFIEHRFVDG
ncbi:hypothetical protein D3C80_1463050 [compost metagenome]